MLWTHTKRGQQFWAITIIGAILYVTIQLSELLLDLPPPYTLDAIMSTFPMALIAIYHRDRTILIQHNGLVDQLGLRIHRIPYHGFELQIAVLRGRVQLKTLERRVNAIHPKAIAILIN